MNIELRLETETTQSGESPFLAYAPEFRDVLAKDPTLQDLRKVLAEADRVIAITNNPKQLELAKQRIADAKKRTEQRTKELLARHQKREQAERESRLLYLQKLQGILQKDLESLSRELKVLGG